MTRQKLIALMAAVGALAAVPSVLAAPVKHQTRHRPTTRRRAPSVIRRSTSGTIPKKNPLPQSRTVPATPIPQTPGATPATMPSTPGSSGDTRTPMTPPGVGGTGVPGGPGTQP